MLWILLILKIAREYTKPFGGDIDGTLTKIEDHLEAIVNAIQDLDTGNIDVARRTAAQEMFKNDLVKTAFRLYWLTFTTHSSTGQNL